MNLGTFCDSARNHWFSYLKRKTSHLSVSVKRKTSILVSKLTSEYLVEPNLHRRLKLIVKVSARKFE